MYNWNDIRHNGGHYDVSGHHQMKVLGMAPSTMMATHAKPWNMCLRKLNFVFE